jgi:hypothetical protein
VQSALCNCNQSALAKALIRAFQFKKIGPIEELVVDEARFAAGARSRPLRFDLRNAPADRRTRYIVSCSSHESRTRVCLNRDFAVLYIHIYIYILPSLADRLLDSIFYVDVIDGFDRHRSRLMFVGRGVIQLRDGDDAE